MKTSKNVVGNICECGNVWFHDDIPESDPSYCPYCGEVINESLTENWENDNEYEDVLDQDEFDPILNKLNANSSKMAVMKCNKCDNVIYVPIDDIKNAKHCPYCRAKLEPDVINKKKEEHSKLEQNSKSKLSILVGIPATIKFKNIFRKPMKGLYYLAYDPPPVDLVYFREGDINNIQKIVCIKMNAIKEIVFK